MLGWHRLNPRTLHVVGICMITVGLIRLGMVFWGAWSDDIKHAEARRSFITDCEAESTPADCAERVETHDKACFFSSGLSSAQAWGLRDYRRCMTLGEPAYLKARARDYAARRDRYKDIID